VHFEMKNYPEAIKNYTASLKIAEEIGDKYRIANNFTNMGEAYREQNNYETALKNYFSALKINEEVNDQLGIATGYKSVANIYTIQKKYAEAEVNYKKSLALATEIGARQIMIDCYIYMAELYEKQNNLKNTIKYLKLHSDLKDSVLNETNSKQIAEMKTKYETEKKDAEIVLLNKDKEVKDAEINKQKTLKYSFIGGLAVLALLSLIVFNNFRVRSQLKLQTLRNKIASDLHDDVGSTLSSIAIFSEVAQQQSKEVVPMLNTIGESARKMLDAMADIVWTINPENDNFEKIILRMRSFAYELLGAKKIEFEFEADDDVSKKKLPMDVRKNLYLIFKEATNNMVKYSEANKASFSIKGEKNELTMLIRDNGKGFDTARETIGNGLKNMKKRAEEIGAKLLVESMPGSGTTIQLLVKIA